MSARALITGINGFTGQYMAQTLQNAGYEVHGLGHSAIASPRCHNVDLSDKPAIFATLKGLRPSVVVHLAGIAFVGHGSPEDFYRVNLIGTRNLLEAIDATAGDLECVLLASSANIYGNRTDGILTEDTLPDPVNDYAVSKLAMEYMARTWLPRLPIVIARPFNYTGIGQSEHFLLPKIVHHFRRGDHRIELGNLDVWRDFNDVRSVCEAYLGLVKTHPAGGVFNVCSGVKTSLRDVLAIMEKIAGYPMQVDVNPQFVRANEVRTLLGSASRLHALLPNWSSIPVHETLEWMFFKSPVGHV